MEDTAGFYKIIEDELVYAPNFVYSKNYELLKENKDNYELPIDGWNWFETREEAVLFFGIEEE